MGGPIEDGMHLEVPVLVWRPSVILNLECEPMKFGRSAPYRPISIQDSRGMPRSLMNLDAILIVYVKEGSKRPPEPYP